MLELHLLAHNIIAGTSALVTVGAALFTYLNGRKQAANVTFAILFILATIFVLSHIIGANIADPNMSRAVLMGNLCIFFVVPVQIHTVLAIIGKAKEKKAFLWFMYLTGTLFTILFIAFPNLYLLPSVPKMYFPNYYVPGMFHWTRIFLLNIVAIPYVIYQLVSAYRQTKNTAERSSYKYLTAALIIAYIVLFLPNFLVYNIRIDPLWGMPFASLFAIPFAYGTVKYGLLNVRVVAQQAFFYSLVVGALGGLIVLFNYSTGLAKEAYPNFPMWAAPFVSSLLVVTISVFVWQRLKQNDLLKYEFINTVTHKFRTPLTRIKWATENLFRTQLTDDQYDQLGQIQSSDIKLVELTNILISVSHSDNTTYAYRLEPHNLSQIAEDVAASFQNQDNNKQIKITKKIQPDLQVLCDSGRIKFVIQVFFENALRYTPTGGQVVFTVAKKDNDVVVSMKDNGIGVSKDEMMLLFSKFYRGRDAKLSDTEGMGIGLFISKSIVDKHSGKIWAESEGSGKGSTFSFSLPLTTGQTKLDAASTPTKTA